MDTIIISEPSSIKVNDRTSFSEKLSVFRAIMLCTKLTNKTCVKLLFCFSKILIDFLSVLYTFDGLFKYLNILKVHQSSNTNIVNCLTARKTVILKSCFVHDVIYLCMARNTIHETRFMQTKPDFRN